MKNKVEPEGARVIERSKQSESGVLLADFTSLLVEEVASNRVANNNIDSQHTIPRTFRVVSEGKRLHTNKRQRESAAVEWPKTEPTCMLNSESNCGKSKSWATRPHASVIGSCILEPRAIKSAPWKSTTRGNSLNIQFPFPNNDPTINNNNIDRQLVSASKSAEVESPCRKDSGQIGSIVLSQGELRTIPLETQDKHSSLPS